MATMAKSGNAASTEKKSPAKSGTTTTDKASPTAKPASSAAVKKDPTTAAPPPAPTPSRSPRKAEVQPDQRRYYIEVAAYYIAERRGFMNGHEAEDWTAAENEIDQMLRDGKLNA